MRGVVSLLLALCLATPLAAQDSSDDKSYLEGWLQEALSDAGREVTITGFKGALSSTATLDELTIADDDGVWFTMTDASLEWSRSALLSGRLDVSELIANRIVLDRLPNSDDRIAPDDAEAWEFALPELPVSIDIDDIRADSIILGTDVLGEPATLSLQGDFLLDTGEAEAELAIRRTDRDDSLRFAAGFSNETRNLDINFDFAEARDGLVSRLLLIPGTPSLRLQVAGNAPLSDFMARVALTSNGAQRFGGDVKIAALESETASGHTFSADLGGDVRPLFQPDLHPFMGDTSGLRLSGTRLSDGRIVLDDLRLQSGVMLARGDLALAADGWPERFQLHGTVQTEDDSAVRLPLTGPATDLQSATFMAAYDAAQGESWRADVTLGGLSRDGFRIGQTRLAASGTIERAAAQTVTANLIFDIERLTHDDPDLARAIGPAPSGASSLTWQAKTPLEIKFLSLKSGDASLTASGRIGGLGDGFPLTGRATLSIADLSRFAALAGRDIAGATTAGIEGTGKLLGGAFDIDLDAKTRGLRIGMPQVDGLLNDQATLSLALRRDTNGSVLDRLTVKATGLTASASGRVNAQTAQLTLEAQLAEIARVDPRLSGPATIDTNLSWASGGQIEVQRLNATGAAATLAATGTLDPENPQFPATGQLTLVSTDLSRLAKLAGRPLTGQVQLSLEGSGEIRGQMFDLVTALDGKNIRTGLAEIDRLMAGAVTLESALAVGPDVLDLRYLKLVTPRVRANAGGTGPGQPVAISARLSDVAILAPGFAGPATARGSVTIRDRFAQHLGLALDATGPGGTVAGITGDLRDYGQDLALHITGRAPLALANRFISPRSIDGPATFDLRLDGPASLSSLTGRLALANARLSLPTLNAVLSGLSGNVTLSSGQAVADISGTAGTGGGFRLRGPVALTPPFNAALKITLSRLGLSDPNLFRTTLDGTVTVTGPLTGGATIGGAVLLGQTEVQVPSGGGTSIGTIGDIRHINEPAAVAATRRRAGLTGRKDKSMASFPLDLVISAPNRIFVRGRGLDAELGGEIRLGGTTTNVSPSGVFEMIRGRLDILGRRLELTRGLIDLRGSLDPYILFMAETKSDDITVRVTLEGLASAPEVTFSSDPDLPQEEAVARLLFGRGLDAISPFQAAQLVAAAATLSGRRSGGLMGGLRGAFGLSNLDVTSAEGGATQFSAGTYISENIYSNITADDEGNQEINLNLDVTPHLTVKGRSGTTGDTGIGIYFEKDY